MPGQTFASAFDPWKPRPWMSPFGAAAMPQAAGPMPQPAAPTGGPQPLRPMQGPATLSPRPTVMPNGSPGRPAVNGGLPVPADKGQNNPAYAAAIGGTSAPGTSVPSTTGEAAGKTARPFAGSSRSRRG